MDFMEVFSKFAETVLVAVLPVLAGFLVVWVKAKIEEAKAKIAAYKPGLLETIEWVAGIAVSAAEQSEIAGYIEDKRKYAFDLIENYLVSQGLEIDIDLIYAAIEAEVSKKAFPHRSI